MVKKIKFYTSIGSRNYEIDYCVTEEEFNKIVNIIVYDDCDEPVVELVKEDYSVTILKKDERIEI